MERTILRTGKTISLLAHDALCGAGNGPCCDDRLRGRQILRRLQENAPLEHPGLCYDFSTTSTKAQRLTKNHLVRQCELASQLDVVGGAPDENREISRLCAPILLRDVVKRKRPAIQRDSDSSGLTRLEISLANPFNSLTGRGTLAWESPTYNSATSAATRWPIFFTSKETETGSFKFPDCGVTDNPL
jgi:hypothetical protein